MVRRKKEFKFLDLLVVTSILFFLSSSWV
uniref:Uncharacterized protein n=1 Tax=Rhizophora mucronata TaxID=61149 RepID=A0A2P2M0C3_RHIMU